MKRNSLLESLKQQRIENVNAMIKVIGDCGRGFFKHNGQYASIECDWRGRVWWNDDYTEKRIYLHYRHWNRGFSHGGTLRTLVNHFRDYVTKGTKVPASSFGPFPQYLCDGDLWGYGKDMETVREAARQLFIIPMRGGE